ncbi:MAG: SAM-dependent methyltransferase, partial [Dolichospermum sp.]
MTETLVKSITPRPVTPLGILLEELETTLKIAKQENVSSELTASLQKVYELASGIEPYWDQHSTNESPALAAFAQQSASEVWGG